MVLASYDQTQEESFIQGLDHRSYGNGSLYLNTHETYPLQRISTHTSPKNTRTPATQHQGPPPNHFGSGLSYVETKRFWGSRNLRFASRKSTTKTSLKEKEHRRNQLYKTNKFQEHPLFLPISLPFLRNMPFFHTHTGFCWGQLTESWRSGIDQ